MLDNLATVQFYDSIWASCISEATDEMIVDLRSQQESCIQLARVHLKSLAVECFEVDIPEWSKLVHFHQNTAYYLHYVDAQDPNKQTLFGLDLEAGIMDDSVKLPNSSEAKFSISLPHLYEQGTAYHDTVANFLSLDLPLSCEYLEWRDKIIISYYLRSGKAFERNLLLLTNGQKEWKLQQDEMMKGFSPESFFIYQNQLIFIRNKNEICLYDL